MFNKIPLDYIVIMLVILYILFFLNSCSTAETTPCLRWSTKEVKETQCTRIPNRICVDEIYYEPVCLVREKDG